MIKDASVPSIFLFLTAVFLASVSQALLKKSAMSRHLNPIYEYLNWRVLSGYLIMFGCTLTMIIAYQGIPLSLGMALETTSYIYVTLFGVTIFKERFNIKKVIAFGFIIGGIFLYAL